MQFYRELSHIDIVVGSGNSGVTGVHWAVSQATAIRDVRIHTGDGKQGVFCENGSGGWISDLVITGGDIGINIGSQQWTMRNITVSGSRQQCINVIWNWEMVLMGLVLSNCPNAIAFTGGSTGSLLILDSTITDVSVGVSTGYPARSPQQGLLLENLTATRVPTLATGVPGDASGTVVVPLWVQGVIYNGSTPAGGPVQRMLPPTRSTALPGGPRPDYPSETFFNAVTDGGAVGDGVADDTKALQASFAGHRFVFLPGGEYRVSDTLQLQPDAVVIGEGFSTITAIGGSPVWANAAAPAPMLAVPSGGVVTLASLMLSVSGDAPGAILLSWSTGPASTTHDVHFRVEHTVHTLWSVTGASTGGVFENSWAWVADHDINGGGPLAVVSPRGIHVEGVAGGPLTFLGVAAEHSMEFQYNISASSGITIVMAQTEVSCSAATASTSWHDVERFTHTFM